MINPNKIQLGVYVIATVQIDWVDRQGWVGQAPHPILLLNI